MDDATKIERIKTKLLGVHKFGMTEIELEIWEIAHDQKATPEERQRAKKNTETLEFADENDEPYPMPPARGVQ